MTRLLALLLLLLGGTTELAGQDAVRTGRPASQDAAIRLWLPRGSVRITTDDGVVGTGYSYTIGTGGEYLAIVRLNQDGSADTGFGLGGQNFISVDGANPTHSFAKGIAVQIDGRIVVSGAVGPSPGLDIDQVVAGMEALREAGSYSIFVGEAGKCESKLWGGGNCCKAKSGGGSYSNYSMAGTIGASVLSYAGEWAVHLGSNYLCLLYTSDAADD